MDPDFWIVSIDGVPETPSFAEWDTPEGYLVTALEGLPGAPAVVTVEYLGGDPTAIYYPGCALQPFGPSVVSVNH